MSVEYQQSVAEVVYSKLKLFSPSCILAGGAPRDWYFGNECVDLDFYFQVPEDLHAYEVADTLKTLGFDVSGSTVRGEDPKYESMSNLVRIFNCVVGHTDVQLIQVNTKPYCQEFGAKVQRGFNNTLSKVWYHGGEVQTHKEFDFSVKHKIVGVTDEAPNIKKTQGKFPDYKLLNMEEFWGVVKVLGD